MNQQLSLSRTTHFLVPLDNPACCAPHVVEHIQCSGVRIVTKSQVVAFFSVLLSMPRFSKSHNERGSAVFSPSLKRERGTCRLWSMKSTSSPWGEVVTTQEIAAGVFWVETTEHGGLLIEADRAQTFLSYEALELGKPWTCFLAYEQEHDLPVVFYEHPEWYPWVEEELTERLAADCLHRSRSTYFRSVSSSLPQDEGACSAGRVDHLTVSLKR